MNGWIKLQRKFLEWEWYGSSQMVHLFIHMMLKANRENKKWQGISVKSGSFISSVTKLSHETGISIQSVRTAIRKLENTRELTCRPTNKYTLFTLVKWRDYQHDEAATNMQANNQSTINQQTTNNQLTTTKEYKKEKNERSNPPIIPPKGGEVATQIPSKSSFDMSVAEQSNMNPDIAFEIFEDWAKSKGQVYQDWNAAWRNACRDWLLEKHAKRVAITSPAAEIQATLVEPIGWQQAKLRYPLDVQQRIGDTWENVPEELKGYLIEDCNKQGEP